MSLIASALGLVFPIKQRFSTLRATAYLLAGQGFPAVCANLRHFEGQEKPKEGSKRFKHLKYIVERTYIICGSRILKKIHSRGNVRSSTEETSWIKETKRKEIEGERKESKNLP